MNVTLETIDPFSPPLRFTVEQLPAVFGRNGQSDVKIDSRWTSDRHCEIVWHNGDVSVRDLHSEHGTLVNGKPVKRVKRLHPDDQLTIGVRMFRVSYKESAEVQARRIA